MKIFISLSAKTPSYIITEYEGKKIVAVPNSKRAAINKIQVRLNAALSVRNEVIKNAKSVKGKKLTPDEHKKLEAKDKHNRDLGEKFMREITEIAKTEGLSGLKLPLTLSKLWSESESPDKHIDKFGARGVTGWLSVLFMPTTAFEEAAASGTTAKPAEKLSGPAAAYADQSKKKANPVLLSALKSIIGKHDDIPQKKIQLSGDLLHISVPDGTVVLEDSGHDTYVAKYWGSGPTISSGPVDANKATRIFDQYLSKYK